MNFYRSCDTKWRRKVAFCLRSFAFPILGQLLGGWNQAEVNDESIQDVAQFALTTINQRSNSLYLSKMVEVIRAERQVSWKWNSYGTLLQVFGDIAL